MFKKIKTELSMNTEVNITRLQDGRFRLIHRIPTGKTGRLGYAIIHEHEIVCTSGSDLVANLISKLSISTDAASRGIDHMKEAWGEQ